MRWIFVISAIVAATLCCVIEANEGDAASSNSATPLVANASSGPSKPSFSCVRKLSEMEKLICSNKDLAATDRAIATSYKSALAKLGPSGRKYLTQDQQNFVAVRDSAYERSSGARDESEQKKLLFDWMKRRAKFLSNISYSRPNEFEGHWENVAGYIDIESESGRKFDVEIETATTFFGTFVCEAEAVGAVAGGVLKATDVGVPDAQINLTREGDVLKVRVVRLSTSEDFDTSPFCGHGWSIKGVFFKSKDQ